MEAGEFREFFTTVNGVPPFPWQVRLAEQVVTTGSWPAVLALPTSAGKTAVIDIAVFALACAAAGGATEHRAPRRIFFIIDRRIVVDEAYERACTLAEMLLRAASKGPPILHDMATALRSLGGMIPLAVAVLRGGVYRDETWTRSPSQPLVCVSTVDQFGSRLLFRGYGLGTTACNPLPIHAGLLGNDALVLLDEAHLSHPLDETLSAVTRYRGWSDVPCAMPWQVVRLSATPTAPGRTTFREASADRHDPVLGKRLRAQKLTRLIEVPCDPGTPTESVSHRRQREGRNRAALVNSVVEQARAIRGEDRAAQVIGIVVNRVAAARAVFEQLGGTSDSDAILLTGRTRPHDRDALLGAWLPRVRAGRDRHTEARALYVVATQCVEVGANLDFDALITEIAPLDALRQRFGRLDRLGERGQTRGVIVAPSDQIARGAEDRIYGTALGATWRWFQTLGRKQEQARRTQKRRPHHGEQADTIDMGVAALTRLLPKGEALAAVCSPVRHAPTLLPAHLDLWVQTSSMPAPDPDVALFLHGPDTEPADVRVVWRADLLPEEPTRWVDTISLLPPMAIEGLPLAVGAVVAWLRQRAPDDMADVEGGLRTSADGGARTRSSTEGRWSLRWAGPDDPETMLIPPDAIRPGDTIVIPATFGGADGFGWNPTATGRVSDIGDAVWLHARRLPVLRLHRELLHGWGIPTDGDEPESALDAAARYLRDLATGEREEEDLQDAERHVLNRLAEEARAPSWVRTAARYLVDDPRRRRVLYPGRSGVVLMGGTRLPAAHRDRVLDAASSEFTGRDDTSSFTRHVSLRDHSNGVQAWAQRFAAHCGLPDELAADVALAGWLHDLGKADPRFQMMLHGGDEVSSALAEEPLAKSSLNPRDRLALRRARACAGLPVGYRHEATSMALMANQESALQAAHDPDLVLHLVGSHHGCGRPFIPSVNDPVEIGIATRHGEVEFRASSPHGLARFNSGVSDRFWQLVRRYGWYGLAYLEALLRLADQRRSEEEQYPHE